MPRFLLFLFSVAVCVWAAKPMEPLTNYNVIMVHGAADSKGCSFPGTPVSIDIATQMNGQTAAKVFVEIISVQKLSTIPDALFEVQGK